MIHNITTELKQARLDLIGGVVYSKVPAPLKGTDIELEMYIMKDSSIGFPRDYKMPKKPTILWVMGGAWVGCPPEKCMPFMVEFVRHGYTVAAAQYRVTSEAVWPAQIMDVMTAVRFLRAHADEYAVDENKIAVMGLSAGGHLTAMAAMNPTEYGSDEWSEYSSEVQAAIDMFGPSSLKHIVEDKNGLGVELPQMPPHPSGLEPEEMLIGGKMEENIAIAEDASPTTHISDKACPILIMHGSNDLTVPITQSIRLHDALNAAGQETDMYIIDGAGHGTAHFFQTDVKQIMLDFLDKHLK